MIPARGPIGPLERSRRESRAEQHLDDAWERRGDASAPFGQRQALDRAPDRFAPLLAAGDCAAALAAGPDAVVCALPASSPAEAVEAVLAAARDGARLYLLAEPTFGEGRLSDLPGARVLVRQVSGLPAACLLGGRGRHGGIWLGTGSPAWWLPLSETQGEALFAALVHLFWHEARREAWTGGGEPVFRRVDGRPFDAPPPPPGAAVELVRAGEPPPVGEADLVHDPLGRTGPGAAPRLLLRPPGPDTGSHAPLLDAGGEVLWDDLDLPPFSLSGCEGTLTLAATGGWELRVRLEPDQAGALREVAEAARREPAWRLHRRVRLGDVRGDVQLPGTDAPSPLAPSVRLSAGRVLAERLLDMDGAEPAGWPEPPPLALEVTFDWRVDPPRAPKKAKEDALVRAWRELDRGSARRVEAVRRALSALEGRSRSLSGRFRSLAGALLGFDRRRGELAAEAEALSKERPSAYGPEGAPAWLDRLAALERGAQRLGADLGESERQAHEGEERRRQRREWEEGSRRAREEAEALGPRLEELEAELRSLDAEVVALGEEPPLRGKRAQRTRRKKDQALRQSRTNLEGRLRKDRSRLRSLQERAEAPFEYRPTRPTPVAGGGGGKGAARFVPPPAAASADQVPAEALPSTGRLVRHGDTRYLVVARWEEVEEARAEASRLSARLVAPRGKA